MRHAVSDAISGFNMIVLGYFVALNVTYLAVLGGAVAVIVRARRRNDGAHRDDIFANPLTPGVSILVPAFNEAAGITESVRSLLALRYPIFEVIVVDDGSTDDTFAILMAEFDLREVAPAFDVEVETLGAVHSMHVASGREPLTVVRKTNAKRRADALNVGLNVARYPLVCMIDADSILEPDALLRIAQPFIDDPEKVIATGGVIRAANGATVQRGCVVANGQPRRWVERIQAIEYLRAFLVGRTGWSRISGLLIISGAFGLFRRDAIIAVGGLDASSLGEDADLVASLHRHYRDEGTPYSIVFVPEPVCWTELPSNCRTLASQRCRWSSGLAQVLWKQRRMMLNPLYGRIGMLVLPYYLVFELLGPVVELLGLVSVAVGSVLGLVNLPLALLLATMALAYGALLSFAALATDELTDYRPQSWKDLGIAAVAAVAENFGYRQLHAWWRLKGLVRIITGRDLTWGEMPRAGFAAEALLASASAGASPPSASGESEA